MPKTHDYAADFEALASRFEDAARSGELNHVSVLLVRCIAQADALIVEARKAGALDDLVDHDGKCPTRFVHDELVRVGLRPWYNVVCGWLVKQYPGRIGPHAGELDAKHFRIDEHGQIVDKAANYTRADWLAHQQTRARDHAAAARLVRDLIREAVSDGPAGTTVTKTAKTKKATRGRHVTRTALYPEIDKWADQYLASGKQLSRREFLRERHGDKITNLNEAENALKAAPKAITKRGNNSAPIPALIRRCPDL